MMSVMPLAKSFPMAWSNNVRPLYLTNAFGLLAVRGYRRVPNPAANMNPVIFILI